MLKSATYNQHESNNQTKTRKSITYLTNERVTWIYEDSSDRNNHKNSEKARYNDSKKKLVDIFSYSR